MTRDDSANPTCTDPGEGTAGDPRDDCNDADATVYTGAPEIVGNNVDNNCNGRELCYYDADNDGYARSDGASFESTDADCNDSGEAVSTDPRTDCCDSDASAYPGQTAWFTSPRAGCGGYDYNCVSGAQRRWPSVATACSGSGVCVDYSGWSSSVPRLRRVGHVPDRVQPVRRLHALHPRSRLAHAVVPLSSPGPPHAIGPC
ncbi:MAG: putative metal-binding motif-containing protein [Sandaracinaceae bacterium]|nr:putative metal-binding motif-containing protein [Sandaracinaceae bacterium]